MDLVQFLDGKRAKPAVVLLVNLPPAYRKAAPEFPLLAAVFGSVFVVIPAILTIVPVLRPRVP